MEDEHAIEALQILVADLASRVKTIADELAAHDRRLVGVSQRTDDVERRTDARIDHILDGQLQPSQIDALVKTVYQLAIRIEALEHQMNGRAPTG